MTDYETLDIESATVTSIVPYADEPELREYTAESLTELSNIILNLGSDAVAERVLDVDICAKKMGENS